MLMWPALGAAEKRLIQEMLRANNDGDITPQTGDLLTTEDGFVLTTESGDQLTT